MSKSNIHHISPTERDRIKQVCLENSEWLLSQAREQLGIGNYGLSTFLAITSYEESLKYGLLQAHESNLISDEKYNKFASYHKDKLLSEFAFIQISVEGERIKQEYILPEKSEHHEKIVKQIIERREKSLYVDFNNSVLNIPTQTNPADATEEINRAYKSIEKIYMWRELEKQLKK